MSILNITLYTGTLKKFITSMCRVIQYDFGVIHNTLQMQPHVISFYGVTSRIRFMFLLFPQVTRN